MIPAMTTVVSRDAERIFLSAQLCVTSSDTAPSSSAGYSWAITEK